MPRTLVLSALVATAACGPLSSIKPDGGGGGMGGGFGGGVGGAAGGGVAGGGVAGGGVAGGGVAGGAGGGVGGGTAGGSGGGSGGGAAGGAAGGAGGGTAGGSGGGAAPEFTFGSVSIVQGTPTSYGIAALGGRAGEVYALGEYGRLYRSTGAAFQEQLAFPSVIANDLWVAGDGSVFIAFAKNFAHCSANCTAAVANYTMEPVASAAEDLLGVCGTAANDVYAVGNRDSSLVGILYHWNGSTFTKLNNNLGVTNPQKCWIAANGDVFISAERAVVRYSGGSAIAETIDFGTIGTSSTSFYGITGVGGELFAVGSSHRILRRLANLTWAASYNPANTSATLHAVGGVSATEVYAAGTAATSKMLLRWNGTSWGWNARDLPSLNSVRDIYFAGSNEVYFGGRDSAGPVIVKGTR